VADFRLYGLQQRAIAATNARPTAANFVNAIVKDTIFPQSSGGAVKTTSTGVTKYGRRGEFVLHIGVDEEVGSSSTDSADISSCSRTSHHRMYPTSRGRR